MQLKRVPAVLALGFALALSACGDKETTAVDTQALAGTYVATQFLATTSGTTTNILASGGSATLVLNADGTTSGHLFVPGLADANLTGTWSMANSTDIDLNSTSSKRRCKWGRSPSDTFFRDMVFAVVGNTLVGDQTFNGTRIQIILTKQ